MTIENISEDCRTHENSILRDSPKMAYLLGEKSKVGGYADSSPVASLYLWAKMWRWNTQEKGGNKQIGENR